MDTDEPLYNIGLSQDTSSKYYLTGITFSGELNGWRSNDAASWKTWGSAVRDVRTPYLATAFPAYLLPTSGNRLLLFLSDGFIGLQYLSVTSDGSSSKPDLLRRAGLQAYAVVALDDGSFLVALQENDHIELRQYRELLSETVSTARRSLPIYVETDRDGSSNQWQRVIARARAILPDVTAVGTTTDGRIWWGIETGVMSLKDDDFFRQDVSQGFFSHFVSDIVPCGSNVYFASSHLAEPRLAWVRPSASATQTQYAVEARRVAGVAGRITSIACDEAQRVLFIGTSKGDIAALADGEVSWRTRLDTEQTVTALAVDPYRRGVYVGTNHGEVHWMTEEAQERMATPTPTSVVSAMVMDREQQLWLAIEGQGLYAKQTDGWHHYTPSNSALPYGSIGVMKPDPAHGIWILPAPETRSIGLVFFDGTGALVLNPPHRTLETPVDLAVAPDGDLFIATAATGLHILQRASPSAQ